MITADWSVVVHRPAAEVFDFVADLRNEPRFNPDSSDVEQLSPGPIALGTAYSEHFKGIGRYRTTIDRYERPTDLGFDARNPRSDARVRFRFTPRGESDTEVRCRVELDVKGAMRVLAPLMAPVIRRRILRTRGPMLKRALESDGAGPLG